MAGGCMAGMTVRQGWGTLRTLRVVVSCLALAGLAACGGGGQGPVHHARQADYSPPGPPHDPWGPYIVEASRRYDVPETWIREVMRVESAGRPMALSNAGAMGLMQVMPATYAELAARHDLGPDPYYPKDNILAGTAYLREMYDRFGNPAFLAAYNGGPGTLDGYLRRGSPREPRRAAGLRRRCAADEHSRRPQARPPWWADAARRLHTAAAACRTAGNARRRRARHRAGARAVRLRRLGPCLHATGTAGRVPADLVGERRATAWHGTAGHADRPLGDPGRRLLGRGAGEARRRVGAPGRARSPLRRAG